MTTAERSTRLAQDIAADMGALRARAVRLADQQSQLVAHAVGRSQFECPRCSGTQYEAV